MSQSIPLSDLIPPQYMSWLLPTSELFAVQTDAQRFSALNLPCTQITTTSPAAGLQQITALFRGDTIEIDCHFYHYAAAALVEMWQTVHNSGPDPLTISRLDSFSWNIPAAPYNLLHYTSDWGQEFESVRAPLTSEMILETRYGRSSKGQHPWFALSGPADILSGSIAWSGNWIMRFIPLPAGGYQISGGLHDWAFTKELQPGQQMETPHAVLVLGDDLNAVSQQYARVGRRYWYPPNPAPLLTEWNHWFSYEDAEINESVFSANLQEAARLGLEACALDAGWFGPTDAGTFWHNYRGDWHLVNQDRFPHGIRTLSDEAHALNVKFGLWCEIEGLGQYADIAVTRPDLPAVNESGPLGYICFGNPQAQDWAYETLCRLIADDNCDWIKLDFNVDPGAGCTRTDHGHGPHDGLYEHYRGYYATIDRLRLRYPHVLFENCSSGGLRIDLEMARHTHMTFLSDPDWPVHDLQIFWGASTMLAPDVCLHWSYSEWRSDYSPQKFNPRDPNLQPHQLDYYTRISMLGWFGLCQKLPDLPSWVRDRLAFHTRLYQQHVRRFILSADLSRLTDQPRRDGSGDRWCVFQYTLPAADEHLLFVFRLPGGEPQRAIYPAGLDPHRTYQIVGFEGETYPAITGSSGLTLSDLPEEGSALLRVIPVPGP